VPGEYIARWEKSSFRYSCEYPWTLTRDAALHVQRLLSTLDHNFELADGVARHRTSIVEEGATIKGPAIIGENCFIAAGALLRGGCYLERDCIIGPGSEVKSSFLFSHTRLAHFNFVGDSILGEDVNLEAGSIIANYRNELPGKTIRIGETDTGVFKFGAVVGDRARIGANAVIAPGAMIQPGQIIGRLQLVDQHPDAR